MEAEWFCKQEIAPVNIEYCIRPIMSVRRAWGEVVARVRCAFWFFGGLPKIMPLIVQLHLEFKLALQNVIVIFQYLALG
jgi:hypothetical protein